MHEEPCTDPYARFCERTASLLSQGASYSMPRNVANTTEEGSRYRYSKHIFVGSERVVTRLRASTGNWAAEDAATYWYHPDHLGSTSVVTDPDGEAYERIEYTPFGEMWLEHQHDANTRGEGYIPFRFTSKEWDEVEIPQAKKNHPPCPSDPEISLDPG